jgi:hypothetical protein
MRLASTTPRLGVLAGAAAAALACAAQPAAAAVAINGELNAVANAYADGHPTVTSTDHQAWSGAPATLNTSVLADSFGGVFHDHNDHVSSFGAAQATWASANSGSVDFTNYGWNFSALNNTQPDGADLDANRPGDGADWSYNFTATGDGSFTMAYNVVGSGATLGLFGWNIFFSGGGSGGPDLNSLANDPTTSGVFSAAITHGQTYTIALYGNPNVAGFGPQVFASSMNGTFDWRIDERGGVPEPASWALMLVGFGGLGAMLRARRRVDIA